MSKQTERSRRKRVSWIVFICNLQTTNLPHFGADFFLTYWDPNFSAIYNLHTILKQLINFSWLSRSIFFVCFHIYTQPSEEKKMDMILFFTEDHYEQSLLKIKKLQSIRLNKITQRKERSIKMQVKWEKLNGITIAKEDIIEWGKNSTSNYIFLCTIYLLLQRIMLLNIAIIISQLRIHSSILVLRSQRHTTQSHLPNPIFSDTCQNHLN